MKRILIYGDSNVWGDNFSGLRIPYHLRWTNRLKRSLKNDYEIIANGVCGRIAGNYRSNKPECNGQSSFYQIYGKVGHVDVVMVALGTNDFQERFSRTADDIINDLLWYKNAVGETEIIYILPPNFSADKDSGPEFTLKSQKIRNQIMCNKEKLGNYIIVDNIELSDGIHFSSRGHKSMAKIVGEEIKAGL